MMKIIIKIEIVIETYEIIHLIVEIKKQNEKYTELFD